MPDSINIDVFKAWDDLLTAANPNATPAYEASSTLGTGGYMEVSSFLAKGYELDLTANLAKNWTLAYNIAFPTSEAKAGARFSQAWLNENIDYIRSEAAKVDAALGTSQGTDLAEAGIVRFQNAIDTAGAPGREPDNSYEFTSNLFTNYRFTDGRLKGFSIGGGANVRGKRIIGNLPSSLFDYVYQPSRVTYNARFGYNTEIGNNGLKLQLNIDNLLDDQHIEPVSFTDITTGDINDYTVFSPRSIDLTATFEF